jgi:hypothetical protein
MNAAVVAVRMRDLLVIGEERMMVKGREAGVTAMKARDEPLTATTVADDAVLQLKGKVAAVTDRGVLAIPASVLFCNHRYQTTLCRGLTSVTQVCRSCGALRAHLHPTVSITSPSHSEASLCQWGCGMTYGSRSQSYRH